MAATVSDDPLGEGHVPILDAVEATDASAALQDVPLLEALPIQTATAQEELVVWPADRVDQRLYEGAAAEGWRVVEAWPGGAVHTHCARTGHLHLMHPHGAPALHAPALCTRTACTLLTRRGGTKLCCTPGSSA